jgi:hypothetical protein
MSRRTRIWVIAGSVSIAVAAVFLLPPIPQSQAYHSFADQRTMLGIPRCLDVVSNAPFLLVGLLGIAFLIRRPAQDEPAHFIESRERWHYFFFFLGVTLTSLGSSYYHLAPGNERLVWDRLPMTLGFMSLTLGNVHRAD